LTAAIAATLVASAPSMNAGSGRAHYSGPADYFELGQPVEPEAALPRASPEFPALESGDGRGLRHFGCGRSSGLPARLTVHYLTEPGGWPHV
jgi:hypothetical protein